MSSHLASDAESKSFARELLYTVMKRCLFKSVPRLDATDENAYFLRKHANTTNNNSHVTKFAHVLSPIGACLARGSKRM